MREKGILFVVSGFSGAGKGTLMKMLSDSGDAALSVSATTRAPREGEQDGKDYFFVTRERFEEMIRLGELYEYTVYADNYYGTPRKYVDDRLSEGKDVILEIEVQGAAAIRRRFPDTVLLFVTPPTVGELKRRLVNRGTETEEKIRSRLARAVEESACMSDYDYILINDDKEVCARDLRGILRIEHMKASRSGSFISGIKEELENIKKGDYVL